MTQNAIDNKVLNLTIDPLAASDSFVQISESAVSKWRMGNNATDDSFRLSQSSALGTTDTFVMTSVGERTLPLLPAFLANKTGTSTNVTGNNNLYTIIYNSEITDQGSDYATGSGIFTAPVTGNYRFNATAELGATLVGCTAIVIALITSNRNYSANNLNGSAMRSSADIIQLMIGTLSDMDAADTAHIVINGFNQGSNSVDALGNTDRVYFSGCLEC